MSTKQNQHVEEYLNAYREMADVDFAVMITGPWGCGKTHFITEYLDEHCATGDEKEYLYISLNGVARTADIDMALFQAAHPVLGSKLAVTAGKIFKASLKAGLKIDLDVNNDGTADGDVSVDPLAGLSLAKFKLSTKGKLLVFDDLERCLLKPEEVLGYINAFVENKEAKVLVIGDEKLFGITSPNAHKKDDTSEKVVEPNGQEGMAKYWMIKEKVVGKTFRLTERVEEIFDALMSEDIFPQTYELIVRNKDAVIRMFQNVSKDTGKYNYRALKHCFRDFEYFYLSIDSSFHVSEDFLNDLFLKFLTLDYELQIANYDGSELETGDMADIYAKAFREDDDTKDEVSKLALVLQRHDYESSPMYPSMDTMIFSLDLWGRILRNEWTDKSQVTEAIKNSSYFPDKQSEWVVLWHWGRIEDSVAEQALSEVQEKLKNHEYRSRETIMHVFSILRELAELDAIKESSDDILAKARQYLSDLVDQKLMVIPERDFDIHWAHSGSYGLEYWSRGSDYFRQLLDLIDDSMKQAIEDNRQASVDTWLEQLRESSEKFLDDISTEGKYYREPILKYFEPAVFVATLDQMGNEKKWIARAVLKKRYEFYSKDLIVELPFFESVLQELEELLESHSEPATPSIINMEYLKKDVEIIVESLRAAAKRMEKEEQKTGDGE